MPTWDEIKDFARSKYTLSRDEDNWFSLVWDYDTERTQLISVRRFPYLEQDWIEFRTFVCKEAELAPRVALRKNAEFAIGALALDADGDYCMVYNAPLATLDPDEFTVPLNVLAAVADKLEDEHSAKDEF
jgi:hypothetical protein